jgi:glycosyltransferase involved in cell wall biosynthesis
MPLNISVDTKPLTDGNAIRGVGMYTRLLKQYLAEISGVNLLDAKTNDKPDLIHYPFFDLFFSTLPLNNPAPIVVTVHDVIPLKFPEFYPAGVKGKLRFLKQRAAVQKAAAVITDSHSSKADIEELLKVDPSKVHVVYLAGNPELSSQSQAIISQVKRKYRLPKNYILYVGDINYNKNIPQLIKSLKFLPEKIHLVCLGKNFSPQNIPEWQWIETQVAMSNVADRVTFVSDVNTTDAKDLAAIYSGATAYVQPSLYEGFGLPVLEAMQCRTPVVCSNTSSLPEIAGDQAVMVEPAAEDLAAGVSQILEWSDHKRQLTVRQAYAWSQKFSWQKTAKETYKIYQQVSAK